MVGGQGSTNKSQIPTMKAILLSSRVRKKQPLKQPQVNMFQILEVGNKESKDLSLVQNQSEFIQDKKSNTCRSCCNQSEGRLIEKWECVN